MAFLFFITLFCQKGVGKKSGAHSHRSGGKRLAQKGTATERAFRRFGRLCCFVDFGFTKHVTAALPVDYSAICLSIHFIGHARNAVGSATIGPWEDSVVPPAR